MRRPADNFVIERATGGYILKYYNGEGNTAIEIFTNSEQLFNRIKELLNV